MAALHEYALYIGDDFIYSGTARRLAEYMGVEIKTVWFMGSPAYHKRLDNRRSTGRAKYVIKLGGDK